jgi:hypothetical protein
VFPLGIGFGLALVGALVVNLAKMRNAIMAAILGLISGVVAIVAMHYFDYQRFLNERQELLAAVPPININNLPMNRMDPEAAEAIQKLKEVRAVNSFTSFMHFQATQGVSIGKIGQGGANLGFVGTWIYWVVELMAVAAMVTFALKMYAASPFCTECNTWKEERKLGTLQRNDEDIEAWLRKGKIERLPELDPAPTGGNLIFTAAVCPNCKSESSITVKVEEVTKDKKGEEQKKELIHLVYSGEALVVFEELFGKESELTEEE